MHLFSSILALFPNKPSEMNMNTWTLSFEGQAEKEYTKQKTTEYIGQKRIGLITAILIYAVFFLLDMIVMPENIRPLIWFIRLMFIGFTIIAIIGTYVERLQPFVNYFVSFILLLASLGNIIMLKFVPADVASSYYAGLILIFMLCYGVLRTNFILSTITGLMILVSYEISAVFLTEVPKYILFNNNFFYLTANVLGMISAYKADYNSRRGFYLTHKLEEAQKALKARPRKYVPIEMPDEAEVLENIMDGNDNNLETEIHETHTFEKDIQNPGHRVAMLMERISDVVWYADLEGNFVYVSPSCEKLWGYNSEEVQNMNFRELFTRESYEYYMEELKSALDLGEEIKPLDLEIICKNRVIKSGELVCVAVNDHEVYGSGVIGVTRDVSLRKTTEQELKRFNNELEELIANRTVELEDALVKLSELEGSLKSAEDEITVLKTEEPVEVEDEIFEETVVYKEEQEQEEKELPIINELKESVEGNLKIVGHLKEMTKQIVKLYDIKTMKRFDLEKYFRESTGAIEKVDAGLRVTAKKLSGQGVAENNQSGPSLKSEPVKVIKSDKPFILGDKIEKVFIGLGHKFVDTQHVVDIHCADEILASGNADIYTSVFENLVNYSLDYGFNETKEGEIIIDVKREEEILTITYSDNGLSLNEETQTLETAGELVRKDLNGEFELMDCEEGIELMIVIPDEIA